MDKDTPNGEREPTSDEWARLYRAAARLLAATYRAEQEREQERERAARDAEAES